MDLNLYDCFIVVFCLTLSFRECLNVLSDFEYFIGLKKLRKSLSISFILFMFCRWVYEGVIDDPHGEFFIAENKSLQKVLHTLSCLGNIMYCF